MKRERLVIKVINVVFVHRGLSFIISVFLYQHVMLPHDSAEHTSGVCMCLWWCSRHWLDRDFIFSLIKVLVYRRRCRNCCYGSRQPSEQQQIFWSDCRFSRNRITWPWKKRRDGERENLFVITCLGWVWWFVRAEFDLWLLVKTLGQRLLRLPASCSCRSANVFSEIKQKLTVRPEKTRLFSQTEQK